MTDAEGDVFASLVAELIFDDGTYCSEALLLPPHESESDLDARLLAAARECGIDDADQVLIPDTRYISTSISNMSLPSVQRSSVSVHSRDTQSTAFTSQPSRNSRDHPSGEQSHVIRSPPLLTRQSLTLETRDALSEAFRPGIQHRHSTSGFSIANSLRSDDSSLRPHSTRKSRRASGLFSMFRKDSSSCSSRSHHSHHFKSHSPKLPCGHSLSKYAIRVHVHDALERKDGTIPACCGQPLPRHVLALVLTDPEVDLVINSSLPSPDATSLRDSGYGDTEVLSVDLALTLDACSLVTEPPTAPITPNCELSQEEEAKLTAALQSSSYKKLKAEQKEQFRRVAAFEANQRKGLWTNHQRSLDQSARTLQVSKTEKTKQHLHQLERLDEFQLVAEHDLRAAHATEAQNTATALKYMEAYCSGTSSSKELVHVVTDEDLRKLQRQRSTQKKLPAKHESAINVLRAKQERDTKLKLQKQAAELQQLEADYESEKRVQELQYVKDSSRLDAKIRARRSRLFRRWDLKFEIWRREWEKESGAALYGTLSHEDWPLTTSIEAPVDLPSSLVQYTSTIG